MLDETVFRGRRLAIVGSICRDVKMGALRPGRHLLEDGETPTAFISRDHRRRRGQQRPGRRRAGGRRAILAGKVGADSARAAAGAIARPPRRHDVHSPRSAGGHRQLGGPELRERLPALRQLPAEQLFAGLVGHRSGDARRRRTSAAGRRLVLRADARRRQRRSCSRPPGPQGLATSLDVNWDPHWGSADAGRDCPAQANRCGACLPLVDLVHGNVRELSQLRRLQRSGHHAEADHGLGRGRDRDPPGGRRRGILLPRAVDRLPRPLLCGSTRTPPAAATC